MGVEIFDLKNQKKKFEKSTFEKFFKPLFVLLLFVIYSTVEIIIMSSSSSSASAASEEKTLLIIDGSYFTKSCQRTIGHQQIDFSKLLHVISRHVRIHSRHLFLFFACFGFFFSPFLIIFTFANIKHTSISHFR